MSTSSATIGTGSQTPSGKPTDEQAFLQVMFKEYCDRLRQNETLRQQAVAVVFALSGALASVEGALLVFAVKPPTQNASQGAAAPSLFVFAIMIGVFVIVLGILGRHLAIKLSERVDVHEHYSRLYRNELQKIFGEEKYRRLRKETNDKQKCGWSYKYSTKTHVYWVNINYYPTALGFIMAIIPLVLLVLSLRNS